MDDHPVAEQIQPAQLQRLQEAALAVLAGHDDAHLETQPRVDRVDGAGEFHQQLLPRVQHQTGRGGQLDDFSSQAEIVLGHPQERRLLPADEVAHAPCPRSRRLRATSSRSAATGSRCAGSTDVEPAVGIRIIVRWRSSRDSADAFDPSSSPSRFAATRTATAAVSFWRGVRMPMLRTIARVASSTGPLPTVTVEISRTVTAIGLPRVTEYYAVDLRLKFPGLGGEPSA